MREELLGIATWLEHIPGPPLFTAELAHGASRLRALAAQCGETARAPLLARIAELEGQLALAQVDGPDAKRYRWLRDNDGDAWFDAYGVLGSALVSDLVDQAVDKVMKESGDA
ncbi:MAG TPA: hypothetical protein VFV47_07045 [Hyphomicrobiaceae bacterium]|nr:hypothetical protein [Hyphomicrobiaceae bacterium]